jgi:hypothetical protein
MATASLMKVRGKAHASWGNHWCVPQNEGLLEHLWDCALLLIVSCAKLYQKLVP